MALRQSFDNFTLLNTGKKEQMKKILLGILILITATGNAQNSKEDKKLGAIIKKSVYYLADDKLEGRRTGSRGEALASEYIIKQFKAAGVAPAGDGGSYIQAFAVKGEAGRTGHNVVGFINNGAANTIVLGAHFDHLGYGEDKNSLYRGDSLMIHNGADDNASGTSALIGLAYWLKKAGLKKYNYVLAAFSGEELGLYGSKYFVEHSP